MSAPLLSVIIPVYNTAPWLPACLDSICSQTYQHLDIICVDDGSTDNSLDILREYEKKDSRIRVLSQKNRGQGAARNMALNICKGDFITGLDADDYLLPETYETCLTAMEDDVDIVCFGIRCVAAPGDEALIANIDYTQPYEGKQSVSTELITRTGVNFVNKIWRRTLVTQGSGKFCEGLRYEDNYFYFTTIPCARHITYLPQRFYQRLMRSCSTMGSTFAAKTTQGMEHLMVTERILDFYADRGWHHSRQELFRYIILNSLRFIRNSTPDSWASEVDTIAAYVIRKHKLDTLFPGDKLLNQLIEKHYSPAPQHRTTLPSITPGKRAIRLLGIPVWREAKDPHSIKRKFLGITIYSLRQNAFEYRLKTPFLKETERYRQYRFFGIPVWKIKKN